MASTSSSVEFTSLVTLHHHDFKVERLHMWWDFFSLDEKVHIKDDIGRAISLLTMKVNWDLLQALASFWDPVLRCLSIGGMDLVPTIEEYTELLQPGDLQGGYHVATYQHIFRLSCLPVLEEPVFVGLHWLLHQWQPGMGGATDQGLHASFFKYHHFSFLCCKEIVTLEFVRWREELGSSFLPLPPSKPAVMTLSTRTSLRDLATSDYLSRILDLEQELEEVRDELDAERAARQESEPHYMVYRVENSAALLRGGGKLGFEESGIRRRFHMAVRIELEPLRNWATLRLRNRWLGPKGPGFDVLGIREKLLHQFGTWA
uniref:DUF7745 domain-containing protein n=1 Tax=Fagus sylvatica TaxID=28930 RepID=A0A2N9F0L4_FAGSY